MNPECLFVGTSASFSSGPSASPDDIDSFFADRLSTASSSPPSSPPPQAVPPISSAPPPPPPPSVHLEVHGRVLPTRWAAANGVTSGRRAVATMPQSASTAPRSARAANEMVAATAPRRIPAASLDLPPPYATNSMTPVPLPPAHQIFSAPAVNLQVSAAAATAPPRSSSPPEDRPLIPQHVRRESENLCTGPVRDYLRAKRAPYVVWVVVNKCIWSHPNHGARSWPSRLLECGFSDHEIDDLIALFPPSSPEP